MRKNLTPVFVLALMLSFFSCSQDDNITDVNKKLQEATSVQSTVSAKSFVESNEKLDMQINLKNPKYVKSLSDTEIAKLKAAVYRFYSTVSVKEGNYYTTLKSAKEINISQDLFELFKNNLAKMNQNINELKKKEGKVEVQQVTSGYLNSLLK